MKLIMTPPPCDLNKNDKDDFYWGVYHFIKALNDYCADHFKHFNCYPLEFEYQNKIYKWEQFNKYIEYQ